MQHFATYFDMIFLVMHSHNWLWERIINLLNDLTIVWPNSRAWCGFTSPCATLFSSFPCWCLSGFNRSIHNAIIWMICLLFYSAKIIFADSSLWPLAVWAHSLTFCWGWNRHHRKWRSWVPKFIIWRIAFLELGNCQWPCMAVILQIRKSI